MRGYLSPKVIPSESEVHNEIMRSTEPEICSEGPARTSKTMRNLLKALALHAKYKGLWSCVARTNSVDLDDSIRSELVNLILRYQLDDPRSQIKQQGGLTKFHHLRLNGGVMRLGGMNRPGAILGGKYDLALLSELSQFSEEQYQLVKTRVTGDSGKWKLKDGTVCFQMLCDTNPGLPNHWMYQREEEGLLKFYKFDFTDNPYYYRKGRWTRVGKTSVNELDRGQTGWYHDIYFKGIRKAPVGAVFQLEDCHFIDELPRLDDNYRIRRVLDFGMSPSPTVSVWLMQHTGTRDLILAREWRKLNADTIEVMGALEEHELGKSRRTLTDNDKNAISILRRHGIPAIAALKGADSVMLGLALMNAALRRTERKELGGLKIYRGLCCNSDSELRQQKRAMSTIDEMQGLTYDETKEATVGERHGVDAVRYDYLYENAGRKERPHLDTVTV